MPKALTRPRGRRARTSDRHERELKRLLLSVCDDTGFRLYLATYDQPKRRDELIERVAREAEAERVRVTRLDLSEAVPETNLVGLLRTHVRETELPPGWRRAVMVSGIEQRLDYSAGPKGFAFLHQANLLRDALPEAAPVPVVLWLSRMASAALPAEAPDLWHWRAANFDFTGDEAPRLELLRELTILRPDDEGGLSGEQRRARVAMLEDLLAELEREGPPNSKRQAAERASLFLELAIEECQLGHAAQAIPRFERALEIFREVGERRYQVTVLRGLGLAYSMLGDFQEAIGLYEQQLAITREIRDRPGEGAALGRLGDLWLELREPSQAIKHYEQQLTIAGEIASREREGNVLRDLGNAYQRLGALQRAVSCHQEALTAYRQIGDRRGEANALRDLGSAYAHLDDLRRAIDHYEQHLAIAREIGHRRSEGRAFADLAAAYARLGEPRRAIDHYKQAIAITRETGDWLAQGTWLFGSAVVFDQLGERDEAIRRMEEALRIFEQIESPSQESARAKLAEWRGEDSG